MPDFKDHIWALVLTLVILLSAYIVLVGIHGTNPKLMDGVLVVIGGIVTLATSAITKAAVLSTIEKNKNKKEEAK
jgi:hypothetical protein